MPRSLLKSLLMYLLSALFLATSVLPVHAHLPSRHAHDDLSHEHQRSVHSHDALDHAASDADNQKVHELSVVDLDHELAGLASLAGIAFLAVGKPTHFPISAEAANPVPSRVASPPPARPVAHDSEPRAPPA